MQTSPVSEQCVVLDLSLTEISWCSPAPVKAQCFHLLTLTEPEEEGVEKHSHNEKPVGNPTEVRVFRPRGPGCDVLVLILCYTQSSHQHSHFSMRRVVPLC